MFLLSSMVCGVCLFSRIKGVNLITSAGAGFNAFEALNCYQQGQIA